MRAALLFLLILPVSLLAQLPEGFSEIEVNQQFHVLRNTQKIGVGIYSTSANKWLVKPDQEYIRFLGRNKELYACWKKDDLFLFSTDGKLVVKLATKGFFSFDLGESGSVALLTDSDTLIIEKYKGVFRAFKPVSGVRIPGPLAVSQCLGMRSSPQWLIELDFGSHTFEPLLTAMGEDSLDAQGDVVFKHQMNQRSGAIDRKTGKELVPHSYEQIAFFEDKFLLVKNRTFKDMSLTVLNANFEELIKEDHWFFGEKNKLSDLLFPQGLMVKDSVLARYPVALHSDGYKIFDLTSLNWSGASPYLFFSDELSGLTLYATPIELGVLNAGSAFSKMLSTSADKIELVEVFVYEKESYELYARAGDKVMVEVSPENFCTTTNSSIFPSGRIHSVFSLQRFNNELIFSDRTGPGPFSYTPIQLVGPDGVVLDSLDEMGNPVYPPVPAGLSFSGSWNSKELRWNFNGNYSLLHKGIKGYLGVLMDDDGKVTQFTALDESGQAIVSAASFTELCKNNNFLTSFFGPEVVFAESIHGDHQVVMTSKGKKGLYDPVKGEWKFLPVYDNLIYAEPFSIFLAFQNGKVGLLNPFETLDLANGTPINYSSVRYIPKADLFVLDDSLVRYNTWGDNSNGFERVLNNTVLSLHEVLINEDQDYWQIAMPFLEVADRGNNWLISFGQRLQKEVVLPDPETGDEMLFSGITEVEKVSGEKQFATNLIIEKNGKASPIADHFQLEYKANMVIATDPDFKRSLLSKRLQLIHPLEETFGVQHLDNMILLSTKEKIGYFNGDDEITAEEAENWMVELGMDLAIYKKRCFVDGMEITLPENFNLTDLVGERIVGAFQLETVDGTRKKHAFACPLNQNNSLGKPFPIDQYDANYTWIKDDIYLAEDANGILRKIKWSGTATDTLQSFSNARQLSGIGVDKQLPYPWILEYKDDSPFQLTHVLTDEKILLSGEGYTEITAGYGYVLIPQTGSTLVIGPKGDLKRIKGEWTSIASSGRTKFVISSPVGAKSQLLEVTGQKLIDLPFLLDGPPALIIAPDGKRALVSVMVEEENRTLGIVDFKDDQTWTSRYNEPIKKLEELRYENWLWYVLTVGPKSYLLSRNLDDQIDFNKEVKISDLKYEYSTIIAKISDPLSGEELGEFDMVAFRWINK